MEIMKALESVKGKGPFLLLTERDVEAFSNLDECEERIAVLGPEPFAVVTLLWTGGPKRTLDLKPDDFERQYRFTPKPEAVIRHEPIPIHKQPQAGWKRTEEKKRPQIVLSEAAIRASLQEIVENLSVADVPRAKEALAALDFNRLLRTVNDTTKPGQQQASDLVPALGPYRVRMVGDYLSNMSYYLDSGDAQAAAEEAEKALKAWAGRK